MAKKIELSVIEHHETVRSRLGKAVADRELTKKEAENLYEDWLKRRNEATANAKAAGRAAAKEGSE